MAATTLAPAQATSASRHTCFHCQEPCPPARPDALDHLRIDDKYFCCEGCKMVYEILNTHDLCEYYRLDEKPGQSLKNRKDSKAYAYLDDAEVQEKLLEFNNGSMAQVTFYLPQMHCVSCIWLLEHLYKLDEGVTHSRVNFLKKTATLQYDP
ncbi:MAG: heavy metal translocating P-type ATPase metal-binding domain-containing protein, partial [Saprospiraceae bacterium]|nr:heavy metal translocating P-type ATPase metal-binding domain-containing protein [Saprospiraceae bacterium]